MVSADTLCKKLLNVKNAVVENVDFYSKQNVITYAYDEGTSFSENYHKKSSALWPDSDVYLAPYVIPGEKSWCEYDNEWYAILVVAPK